MQYTIQRLRMPFERTQRSASALALQEICGLSRGYSEKMVEYLASGLPRLLRVPDSAKPGQLATLGSYFIMSELPDKAQPNIRKTKDITQLKLWSVQYTKRGESDSKFALVLASTKDKAIKSVTNQLSIFCVIFAHEMEAPFSDGLILTAITSQ